MSSQTRGQMTLSRRLAMLGIAGIVGVSGLALGACSSGTDSVRLTIYSGRLQELIGPLLEDFSAETGVGIDVRYGDSADLALLIDEEGEETPADVFLSQSPGAIGYIDESGRLERLDQDVLDLVDERFRAADDDWVGVSGRVRVLVYNTELMDEADLPQSVFDVVDPEFSGQVGVAPSNGSFQDFVTAMREVEGDAATTDWLEGLVANDARTYANNVAIVDAVSRGEVPMGLVNNYYLEQALVEDPSLPAENFIFPDGDLGSLILVTAAGVLKGTDHQREGEQLITFLLSKRAQEFYASETFEYPLARGVQPVGDKPPLDTINSPRIDLSSLGGGLERTRELIAESGLESS
jgi:iron(III) transport system substrate-binding protein